MRFNEVSAAMAEELSQAMSRVSADETAALAAGILRAKRIFLAGAGRSGLMAAIILTAFADATDKQIIPVVDRSEFISHSIANVSDVDLIHCIPS